MTKEAKMQIVIDNYFKSECDVNTSIRKAFEKGFRICVQKGSVYAVEVVRCKDCRWFENDGYHTNCQIMRFCVEAKDYCSKGERRGEQDG